jgi:hypothetical protein
MIPRRYRLELNQEYLLDGQPLHWVGFAHSRERIHQLRRTDGIVVELSDAKVGQLARAGRFRSPGQSEAPDSRLDLCA